MSTYKFPLKKRLINLENIENEIKYEKILKKGRHKNNKIISEKKILNEFIEEFNYDELKKIFKCKRRIITILDNAKTNIVVFKKVLLKFNFLYLN